MKSVLKNSPISPRKMGLVADLVRKSTNKVNDALQLLRFTNKKAAKILYKCIKSAAANGKKEYQFLAIDKIYVGRGVISERWMPRGRGGSDRIKKYTSNVLVFLKEVNTELSSVAKESTTEEVA